MRVLLDPAIPEERLQGREVEERRGISGDEGSGRMSSGGTEAQAALADREAPGVTQSVGRQVTRHARDVPVAAQDLVEGQRLPELHQAAPDAGCPGHGSNAPLYGQLPHDGDQRIGRRARGPIEIRGGTERLLVLAAAGGEHHETGRGNYPATLTHRHGSYLRGCGLV